MRHRKFTTLAVLFFVTISKSLVAQDVQPDSATVNTSAAALTGNTLKNDQKSSYEKLMLQASGQLKKKNYNEARRMYVEAAALDPNARLAKSKIEEIDLILKKQQASATKSPASTSSVLNRRDESYWKDKYAEIRNILAGLPSEKETKNSAAVTSKAKTSGTDNNETTVKTTSLKKSARPSKDGAKAASPKPVEPTLMDRADSAIALGDSMLGEKNYEQSLAYYKEARALKPNNAYAARMVTNVESVLFDLAERQKKADELKQKAQIVEYLDLANKAIVDKKWDAAKDLYGRVLALNPVPSQKEFAEKKIETINLELERIAQHLPPKPEPVVVKKPKNKREARVWKKEEERKAILAGAPVKRSDESAWKDNDNITVVDSKILSQFTIDFNDATDIKWTTKQNYTQADFLREGKPSHAYYNNERALIGASTLLKTADLPMTIRRAIDRKFSGYKLGDVIHFEGPDEIAYYIAAEGEKGKVILRGLRSGEVSLFNSLSDPNSQVVGLGIQNGDLDGNRAAEAEAPAVAQQSEAKKEEQARKAVTESPKAASAPSQAVTANTTTVPVNTANSTSPPVTTASASPAVTAANTTTPPVTTAGAPPVVTSANTTNSQVATANTTSVASTTTSPVSTTTNNVASPDNTASNNTVIPAATARAKTDNVKIVEDLASLNKSFQKEAIEYSRAELVKKYPALDFDKVPDGQMFDVSVDENKLEYGLISDKVLKENSRLSLSDNNNDVRVVCQNIVVNGNNAYIKLLIDNNSDDDFLTGAVRFTFLKENGSLKKLNPRFISNFPVVMPGKKFAVVCVTGVPSNVNPGDIFVIDVSDRRKQLNFTIHIPGDVYNSQK